MMSLVITKLWHFDRDVKKHHKVPEEIYMMTEMSLDDAHTLSHEKLWSHQGHTCGPGKSLPESGWHRKDTVFWTTHAVPGMSLPEISRASERAPSCGRCMQFLKSICQESADTEKTPLSGPGTRSLVTFTWNQQKGRHLLHGCPGERRFPMASEAKQSPKKTLVEHTAREVLFRHVSLKLGMSRL